MSKLRAVQLLSNTVTRGIQAPDRDAEYRHNGKREKHTAQLPYFAITYHGVTQAIDEIEERVGIGQPGHISRPHKRSVEKTAQHPDNNAQQPEHDRHADRPKKELSKRVKRGLTEKDADDQNADSRKSGAQDHNAERPDDHFNVRQGRYQRFLD